MGCWIGTCGITNLPIRYDDKVVGLIIGNMLIGGNASGFVHASDAYVPVSFPLHGTYNDYGSMHIDWDKTNLELAKKIQKYHIDAAKKAGLTKVPEYGGAVDFPEDFDEFIENVISRDHYQFEARSFLHREKKSLYEAGLWVCHAWVWDILMEARQKIYHYDDVVTLSTLQNSADEWVDKTMDMVDAEISKIDIIEDKEKKEYHAFFNLIFRGDFILHESKNLFYYFQTRHCNFLKPLKGSNAWFLGNIKYEIINYMIELRDAKARNVEQNEINEIRKKIKVITDEISKILVFEIALEQLRKCLMPQPGRGSQDENLLLHLNLNHGVLKHTASKLQKYFDDEW